MFDELVARGLIKQTTSPENVKHLLDNGPVTFYIGFDPTADSLHVGHLLQLVFAQRLIDAGHNAILLIGGATASVGDPTGKTDMRKMLSMQAIEHNAYRFNEQFSKIVKGKFWVANNLRTFEKLNFLHFIKEVGPHFSVNNMLRAECFKSRMEHGLSFLEFNYMVMQSWDFLQLNDDPHMPCQLQVGGDDQWSNMLGGIELIRRIKGREAFALTLPLLTTANGQKMGKTEKGAVWLDANKTSVNDFFQFWRNVDDAEVKKLFKLLTFMPLDEIQAMTFNSADEINAAKTLLAMTITSTVHGPFAAKIATDHALAVFGSKDHSTMESHPLKDNEPVLGVIVQAGFAKSNTEARNLINGKGITINDKLIVDPTTKVSVAEFGGEIILRKGKKNFWKFNIV